MNIKFIGNIAKNNPAVARALELGLLSGVIYAIGALTTGELMNPQALGLAVATPLLSALAKLKRDLEKK